MGSSFKQRAYGRNHCGLVSKFKIISFFFFFVSCQTLYVEPVQNIYFYQGPIQFFFDKKSPSYALDVYAHALQPQFRIDIIGLLGHVFGVFLWRQGEYLTLLPSEQKYFKGKGSGLQVPEEMKSILQDPTGLLMILTGKVPQGWDCEMRKSKAKWRKPSSQSSGLSFQTCSYKGIKAEWKNPRFKSQVLLLTVEKNKKVFMKAELTKVKLKKTEKIFDLTPPAHFEQMKVTEKLEPSD